MGAVIDSLDLGGVPLAQLMLQLAESQAASLLAMRLPYNYNTDRMVLELCEAWAAWDFKWDGELGQPERPMPFRVDLGSCGCLFMVCLCGRTTKRPAAPSGWEGFRLSQLDAIID